MTLAMLACLACVPASTDPREKSNVAARERETASELARKIKDGFREAATGKQHEITEEDLERLRSLGYLHGLDGNFQAQSDGGTAGPDPKKMIWQYSQLQFASYEMMDGRFREAEARLAALVV